MDAELKSPDARTHLEAAITDLMAEASAKPMQWGHDDCALWAAEPIRRALGIDPALRFRGHYRTRIGALRLLGKGGIAQAMRAAARRHGWRRIKSAAAMPGDVGLIRQGKVYVAMVCRANGWFVGRNETGFTAVPAAMVKFAWSVVPA